MTDALMGLTVVVAFAIALIGLVNKYSPKDKWEKSYQRPCNCTRGQRIICPGCGHCEYCGGWVNF